MRSLALRITPGIVLACACGASELTNTSPTALEFTNPPSNLSKSGIPLPQQPIVALRDAAGARVQRSGVPVTVALEPSTGSLGGTSSAVTDDAGKATFTNLTISGAVGTYALRFTSPGLTPLVSAPIGLVSGDPFTLEAVAGQNQEGVPGAPLPVPPAVRVLDAGANPLAGVPVSFTPGSSGGTVQGGSATTDASGIARPVAWILGNTAGQYSVTARTPSLPGAEITFHATAHADLPALITVVEGEGQTATIGGRVPISPAVRVTLADGSPLRGRTVTFSVSQGSVDANRPTDDEGIARPLFWYLGMEEGVQTLRAEIQGLSANITATGRAWRVDEIAVGQIQSCARIADMAWCWGAVVGDGNPAARRVPTRIGASIAFASLALGVAHSCALDASGAAWCWGNNTRGQVGDGTQTERLVPTRVGGGHQFTQLVAGTLHSCGLRADNAVLCWGGNDVGSIGDGSTIDRPLPTAIPGGPYVRLSVRASSHTCAIKGDGSAWCWGRNNAGQLGDGTAIDRNVPVRVGGSLSWASISGGSIHTCGLVAQGQAFCWGGGASGQLGNGTNTVSVTAPVAVAGGLQFTSLSAGATQTCGVSASQAAWCWGQHASGSLGDGSQVSQNHPVAVAGNFAFAEVFGGLHSCGRTTTGIALCWGGNSSGQLGDGDQRTNVLTPVGVATPPP